MQFCNDILKQKLKFEKAVIQATIQEKKELSKNRYFTKKQNTSRNLQKSNTLAKNRSFIKKQNTSRNS